MEGRHHDGENIIGMGQRIGLLTLPLNANFGGIIQAVSLSEVLRQYGHEVVLLDRRRPVKAWQKLVMPLLAAIPFQDFRGFRSMERSRRLHRSFINAHFEGRSSVLRSSPEIRRAASELKLDAVVVGSDQVWRLTYMHPDAVADFFLGFINDSRTRRIAYAASFGVGSWEYPDRIEEIAPLLGKFDAVSVREASGVTICDAVFGRGDAAHVLDPTLLIEPEFHRRLSSDIPAAPSPDGRRMAFFYMLDNPDIRSAALSALGPGYAAAELTLKDAHTITLPQWVSRFRDADFVVTDSFHGTVFAIIFRKPFFSVVNHGRGADRFTSLLGQLGLEDRLISPDNSVEIEALVARPIDYDEVHRLLDDLRRDSTEFLERALA